MRSPNLPDLVCTWRVRKYHKMGGSKTLAHDTTQEWSEDENAVLGGHDGLWIRFLTWARWYPKDMNHLEKRLVLKLDVPDSDIRLSFILHKIP